MDTVFQASSLLVAPFWLMMIFVPHWKWTRRIIASPLVIVPAAVLYLILIFPIIPEVILVVMNPSLPDVAALLSTDVGATIAWAHFLTLDLFAGRWIYLDSRERKITAWLMGPLLFVVLMLAPIGMLLYWIVRSVYERRAAR